jgi:hypothetical protein
MSVLLTRKAVLQGAMETTYDTPATVGLSDGFLVSTPTFDIKPNVLERDFVREDLSPLPFIIGRKIAGMEFSTELRGNGAQSAGTLASSPLIARLFLACGYVATYNKGPVAKGPFDQGQPANEVTWVVSSSAIASDTLTMTANFNAGDIVGFDGVNYRAESALAAANDFQLGASLALSLASLVKAINGTGVVGTDYFAGTVPSANASVAVTSGTVITATAKQAGTGGNAIPATYTPSGSSEGAWAHATLTGGADAGTTTDVVAYYLTVDTPGVSGTARVTVTSDTLGEGVASAVVTSGSPITVGTKGLTVTPTFVGSLVTGQSWTVWLMPAGISLDPISDNFQSITLVLHKDGVIHTMPGSFGTFEITAQAGNYAMVKWTFTGTYVAPTNDPNPSPLFERTLPPQVELARLRIGNFQAVVEKVTFNQMNDIQVRPDVSSQDGYIGTRIVGRKPEGGINPEADLVTNNDFWGQMSSAMCMPFQMRVGKVAGNTVWMLCPNTQYSQMTYADRSGILTYDAGVRFARSLGNDESCFYFC